MSTEQVVENNFNTLQNNIVNKYLSLLNTINEIIKNSNLNQEKHLKYYNENLSALSIEISAPSLNLHLHRCNLLI